MPQICNIFTWSDKPKYMWKNISLHRVSSHSKLCPHHGISKHYNMSTTSTIINMFNPLLPKPSQNESVVPESSVKPSQGLTKDSRNTDFWLWLLVLIFIRVTCWRQLWTYLNRFADLDLKCNVNTSVNPTSKSDCQSVVLEWLNVSTAIRVRGSLVAKYWLFTCPLKNQWLQI